MAVQSKLLHATLIAFVAVLLPNSARAEENEAFAIGIGGTKPKLWKDYKSLQDNVSACLQDKRLETKTCQEVQQRVADAMSDALLQATIVSVGNPSNDKFCDKYASELVLDKNTSGMAAYAILLVDERLKYGSGLYPSLQETYIGKIVFDALVTQSPCEK